MYIVKLRLLPSPLKSCIWLEAFGNCPHKIWKGTNLHMVTEPVGVIL